MKAMIFATRIEADFAIRDFAFEGVCGFPFEVFKNRDNYLFICGIGPLAAALCTGYIFKNFKPDFILNAGACGDLKNTCALGAVFDVAKIVSCDPFCKKTFDIAAKGLTVATSSKPVIKDEARKKLSQAADIVDMEAYGIAAALEAESFDLKNFKALKLVSDFSAGCDIEENIKRHIIKLGPEIRAWLGL